MKSRVFHFSIPTFLLLLVVAVAACGGSGNNAEPTASTRATATRRSPAPTRATSSAAQPTQDTIDDSTDNSNQEPPSTEDSARPTQDQLDDSTDNSNLPNPSESGPQVQDGKVVLTNTAWLLTGGERLYQFCQDGKWQVVQGGDTVENRGTYQTEGNTLNLKNTADNQETKYTMTWKDAEKTLELKEGSATLKLEYDGKADCK